MLDFSILRPLPKYPPYPGNYINTDEYIEQYFFNFFVKNNFHISNELNRKYIPIWWTNLFVDNHQIDVQRYLNSLNKNDKWFTICQMDDGVRYNLPPDTLVFHAGGNSGNGTLIPIPLIASPIPSHLKTPNVEKSIFASFVGTYTHNIRYDLYNTLYKNSKYYFNTPRNWSQIISNEELREFIDITEKSTFCLAPAGYGGSSFRLYQSFELNTIPVYISDRKHWLPWKNYLNWEEISVIISSQDIPHIDNILTKKFENKEEIMKMQNKIKELYSEYFSLEGICDKIIEVLKTENN